MWWVKKNETIDHIKGMLNESVVFNGSRILRAPGTRAFHFAKASTGSATGIIMAPVMRGT